MKSEFLLAFNQVCSDRGLSREVVLDALRAALEAAYRRNTGNEDQHVVAQVDLEDGSAQVFLQKTTVEEVTDPDTEIALDDARKIDSTAELGDTVMIDRTPDDFGRIAAQNAKQIILQRIREAEREARYVEYADQEGEIVHGTVQNIKSQVVTLHLEGTEAILPRSQQVPGERYSLHQRIRAYVLEVRKTSRGPQIVVSRSHKNMLRRLLELEVPEIYNGAVEIKAISREAGSRSKVAVAARQPGVDPVGACVGMRGVRIQSIVNELGGEKIDVIEWSADPATFIGKSLSPARVLTVQLDDDPAEGRTASVIVPDDQLSLAIGRSGQNARLAAKLTGWRIDIQGVTEAATWAMKKINEDADVLPALGSIAESLPTVAKILSQHEEEGLSYVGDELLVLEQLIDAVNAYYTSLRDEERKRQMEEETARRAAIEAAREEREAEIEEALSLIPQEAYDISLEESGISSRVLGHLERGGLESVGDVMEHLAEGDEGLLKVNGIGPKSLKEVKATIEALDLPEPSAAPPEELEPEAELEPDVESAEAAPEAVEAEIEEATEVEVEPEAIELEAEAAIEAAEAVEPEAEVAEAVEPEAAPEEAPEEALAARMMGAEEEEEEAPEPDFEEDEDILELEDGEESEELSQRRSRRRRRRLVYDEELGEVVAERRHKREEEESEDWEKYLDI